MKTTKQLFLLTLLFILPMGAAGVEPSADSLRVETCQYAEKDGQPLMLDVYVSAPQASQTSALSLLGKEIRRPVVIFSFGGSWEHGTRKDGRRFLEDFARHGFVAVGIDYRLGIKQFKERGGAITAETFVSAYEKAVLTGVEDLYDATAYIMREADRWQADTSRIVVCGSSAGAINTATAEFLICNDHPLAQQHLPAGFNYKATITLAGGIWVAGYEMPTWKHRPCPFLFYHGTSDQLVPYDKNVAPGAVFAAFGPATLLPQLKEMKVPYLMHTYAGADHIIAGTNDNEAARYEMMNFLFRTLYMNEQVGITITEDYYDRAPSIKTFFDTLKEMGIEQQDNQQKQP